MKKILCSSVVLLSLLIGCAAQSLQGHWTYHDPIDHVAEIDITDLSKNEVYLKGDKSLLSGVYKKKDDLLTMTRPDNPHATGFKLRIVNNNELLVIDEPPTSLTGQKHMSGEQRR